MLINHHPFLWAKIKVNKFQKNFFFPKTNEILDQIWPYEARANGVSRKNAFEIY